jgi:hypothetical protein
MRYKYNPISDTLDLVDAAGGYIDGEVEYHADLPVTVGTPTIDSAFLVRKGSGLYFISRKPAGIWVRELNNGNLDDWKFAGTFSDLFRDANFRIINDADTSKELAFSLSGIDTATTRTLTVPNASGTLPLLETANTFTQNQTLDGTNNVAPNQTAASGSSVMTRALADVRYAEVISSSINANLTAADLSNFYGTATPSTLLINYIPSKAIVYAVIRFTGTPVAATTTNFDSRVSIRDVTTSNLNTGNTQRWVLPCVSVIKISGQENYLLQFESTSPPAGWTTHYNTNGGWLPVMFDGEIINKTGGSLTTASAVGGWSTAHFYR